MNQCTFIGRLTKDVEIKQTSGGKAVGRFTIAVDRKFKDASGQKITDFVPCTCWERQAGFIAHYFKKGDLIAVSGELQSRSYTDSQGNKRTNYEINVTDVDFCGNPNRTVAQNAPTAPATPVDAPLAPSIDEGDMDLPFEL